MLWHNNPSPSILMVDVAGSPEEPNDLPGTGQQRLFTRSSDGHLCRVDSSETITDIEETITVPTLTNYLQYRDEQAQNTHGGTFTSGAWRTRVLNTEVSDVGGFGALASNQITLSAGTYLMSARAPAFGVNQHQARLQNVTDAVTVLVGTSAYSNSTAGTGGVSASEIRGIFTVPAGKALELQHQCNLTNATAGFGAASNFTTEVYAIVELWKIG